MSLPEGGLVVMARLRLAAVLGSALAVAAASTIGAGRTAAREAFSSDVVDPGGVLQVFHSNPSLARAGERVRLGVDVVCVAGGDAPCRASATVRATSGGGPWTRASATTDGHAVAFDLTGPSRRAVSASGDGAVSFAIEANDEFGRRTAVPEAGVEAPLAFYVTRDMPVAVLPVDPGPEAPDPEQVLSLPWGRGALRAGLAPGVEALTMGPSSFDVDRLGRIHLLDGLQSRVAVFSGGRLAGEFGIASSSEASLSVDDSGGTLVLDAVGDSVFLSRHDPRGQAVGLESVGEGIPAGLRAVGERAFVRLLPLGAWLEVGGGPDARSSRPAVGRPVGVGRELVATARQRIVRVATVDRGRVTDAVELVPGDPGVSFGELALAEVLGDGYVLVIRTVREKAGSARDRFDVVGMAAGRVTWAFSVAAEDFTDVPPLSRFRLGEDGSLYQLTTSPDGLRILRFDLPEEATS
jgi:hypothetical protein